MRNLFNYKKAAFSGIGFIAAIFIFGIALFKTYLTEDMKLNNDYEKYADDGSFQYQIIIDKSDIQKSPAKYSIDGRIRMQPVTVRSILPKTFDIPFKLSSNNIRTDD